MGFGSLLLGRRCTLVASLLQRLLLPGRCRCLHFERMSVVELVYVCDTVLGHGLLARVAALVAAVAVDPSTLCA